MRRTAIRDQRSDDSGQRADNRLARSHRRAFNRAMKTQMLPLVGVALIWAFNPALGEGEKYVKIDPATGKPEFISKDDAKKVTAMPDEDKLCEITFKASTTTIAVPGAFSNSSQIAMSWGFLQFLKSQFAISKLRTPPDSVGT